MLNILLMLFLIMGSACSQDYLQQEQKELRSSKQFKPIIACGAQCLTIVNDSAYIGSLNKFLLHQDKSKSVLLASCSKFPASPVFMDKVARSIIVKGYRVARVHDTIPHEGINKACMVLLRGPVMLYPNKCLPKQGLSGGTFLIPARTPLVGSNFGCYSQQNLARMIDDPSDLLVLSGRSGRFR